MHPWDINNSLQRGIQRSLNHLDTLDISLDCPSIYHRSGAGFRPQWPPRLTKPIHFQYLGSSPRCINFKDISWWRGGGVREKVRRTVGTVESERYTIKTTAKACEKMCRFGLPAREWGNQSRKLNPYSNWSPHPNLAQLFLSIWAPVAVPILAPGPVVGPATRRAHCATAGNTTLSFKGLFSWGVNITKSQDTNGRKDER